MRRSWDEFMEDGRQYYVEQRHEDVDDHDDHDARCREAPVFSAEHTDG